MNTIQPVGDSNLMQKVWLSALLVNMGHTVVGALVLAFLSGSGGSAI